MRWILLDLLVAGTALVVLAVLVLGLWRKVKALTATVRDAGERLERATDALTVAQLGGVLAADEPAPPAAEPRRSGARAGVPAPSAGHRVVRARR